MFFVLCLVTEPSNWLQLHYCIMQNGWSLKELLEDSSDPRVTVTSVTLWMDVNLCSKSPYWAQQGSLGWWWTTFPCKCKPLSLSSLQLSSLSIRRCRAPRWRYPQLRDGACNKVANWSRGSIFRKFFVSFIAVWEGEQRAGAGAALGTVTHCSNPLGALLSSHQSHQTCERLFIFTYTTNLLFFGTYTYTTTKMR